MLGSPAEIFRFGFAGGSGCVVFTLLYSGLYAVSLVPDRANASFSWGTAYFISSFVTHFLHRWITFRWRTPYWQSLRRTYVIYGTSLFLTTALHDQLVHAAGLDHKLSFGLTLVLSGCWNYLAFRHWGFRPGDPIRSREYGGP
ncbi:MAG: hypothetical protein CMJ83_10940 [Planctomycetes bacterium]|nr:hypothetical protein [Planctomycetota bacterium]